MPSYVSDFHGERHRFPDLRDVLAKASHRRSGDELAGIAAASDAQRVAARAVLAALPLRVFLEEPRTRLNRAGWGLVNVDVTIFAQEPKLGPVKARIRERLAELLGLPQGAVNVKAKTGERVGAIGRAEAIGCQAVALIERLGGGTNSEG